MSAGRVLLTIAVLAFAFVAAANGLDRVSGEIATVERLVPEPFRAEAHRSAAEINLARQNFPEALGHSRQAVASDPIDPDASALLGRALLLSGDEDGAEQAFRVAARFGWRNFATQAYWFDAALSAGDHQLAADRADALLRAHPQFANEAAFLQHFEGTPAGRTVLAERLQRRPPWLPNYLAMTREASAEALDRRYAVLRQAAASSRAIACEDIAGIARVLLANGRRRQALALWNETCPQRRVSSAIADRRFTQVLPPENEAFPFAWRLHSSGDLSVREAADEDGLLLSLSAGGIRLVLSQTVSLAPGRYRFRVATESGRTSTSRRVFVSWACDRQPPFPRQVEGNAQGEGQLVSVDECERQNLAIWLRGGGDPVQLRGITFERAAN